MKTIECYKRTSVSPYRLVVPDFSVLDTLIIRKPARNWAIDTRESTPDIDDAERQPQTALAYWKDLAATNEAMIKGLDPLKNSRLSISSVEYWQTEAQHLQQEYWKVLQERRGSKMRSKNVSKRTHTSAADGPISSRLRNKVQKRSCQSKTSLIRDVTKRRTTTQ